MNRSVNGVVKSRECFLVSSLALSNYGLPGLVQAFLNREAKNLHLPATGF